MEEGTREGPAATVGVWKSELTTTQAGLHGNVIKGALRRSFSLLYKLIFL